VKFDQNLISGYEDIKRFLWRLRKIIRILHQTESDSCHSWRCWQLTTFCTLPVVCSQKAKP